MKALQFGLCALCLLMLPACGRDIEPGNTPRQAPVVQGLTLLKLDASEVPGSEVYLGSLESLERGVLAARIDGRVARIAVKEGEKVRAGQLLLSLSDTTAPQHSGAAEASVAEARGGLDAARVRLDLAEKTLERYRALFEKEAVTAQEMDRVSAEHRMALKGVEAAQGALGRALCLRDAAVVAAGYTKILAPYDGRVASRRVQEGSTVMPGTPLLVLDRAGALQVRAAFPEALTGKVAAGDAYEVEVPSIGRILVAKVSEVLPVDAATRSFEVKLQPRDGSELEPGLFVRVRPAASGARSALLVPASALLERGQLQAVYVVEAGLLRLRLVKTGAARGTQVEVLSGLRAGETIVVEGLERASDGARVEG